ncbi:acyltransferase [Glutamicibacter halophytocola]|uniref:acyltransferase n=1 Tax=Glutamicibacter halophytocola TaxID=1933880 RepID=UPI0015C55E1E|nr:acyltransferase [Glutamicibacter halophytocola]NQD39371.1 acyltransferase [Glutamicibacter halophytocola]
MILELIDEYDDSNGNVIEFAGTPIPGVKVHFFGSNNRLILDPTVNLMRGTVFRFDCNNATIRIGKGLHGFGGFLRVGEDASIEIGDFVTTTSPVTITSVEGSVVKIGNDCMISADVQIRSDDEHPIFDVRTGERINIAKSISIGNHVWLGWGCRLLGGASMGDGSVVGLSSVVTRVFPNNCIVAGVPARLKRKDVAWERDHLTLKKPFYKPNADVLTRSDYWDLTVE